LHDDSSDDALRRRLYHAMQRIRCVEEEIARVYPRDEVKSPIHLSIGQEAVSVGVCDLLRPHDVVFGTYRGHAAYLAKGGSLPAMLAELYGRRAGCGGGRAGSMHLGDVGAGVMGSSAVVGTTLPQAVGYALALRMRRERRVVVAFFGEGATEEGVWFESVAFAAQRALPILFVCENNRFAICADVMARMRGAGPCGRAEALGVPARRVEEQDVLAVRAAAAAQLEAVRRGAGPRLLECLTWRWREHVGPADDTHLGYRSAEEAKAWQEADPLARLGDALPTAVRAEIDRQVTREIREAVRFAEDSPFPGPEELLDHVVRG